MCGGSKQGAEDAHLLRCLSHRLGIVISQLAVSDKTNKITEVEALIEEMVLTGKVITGDALLTQHTISQSILTLQKSPYYYEII